MLGSEPRWMCGRTAEETYYYYSVVVRGPEGCLAVTQEVTITAASNKSNAQATACGTQ
jgi:Tfp pilus assembly protein PilE